MKPSQSTLQSQKLSHQKGAEDAEPYASSLAHLMGCIALLEARVQQAIAHMRQAGVDDSYRGLVITDEEIDGLMAQGPGLPQWHRQEARAEAAWVHGMEAPSGLEASTSATSSGVRGAEGVSPGAWAHQADSRVYATRKRLHERRTRASRAAGIPLRLALLQERFELNEQEQALLLVALAPEIDGRFDKFYAYLQDNATMRRPGVELALNLTCQSFEERLRSRALLSPDAPLRRGGLLHVFSDTGQAHPTLLSLALKVDERVVDYLHELPDQGLPAGHRGGFGPMLVTWARAGRSLEGLILPEGLRAQLTFLLKRLPVSPDGWTRMPPPIWHLVGPSGTGRKTLSEALAARHGRRLLQVDGAMLLAQGPAKSPQLLRELLREAILQDSPVCVANVDVLLQPEPQGLLEGLLQTLQRLPHETFLIGERPWHAGERLGERPFFSIGLGYGGAEERLKLWQQALATGQPPATQEVVEDGASLPSLRFLSERFRFSAGQIQQVVSTARQTHRMRPAPAPDTRGGEVDRLSDHYERASLAQAGVTPELLSELCRLQGTPQLSSLARKVETPYMWDDLVVSRERVERLREIVQQAQFRHQVLQRWGFEKRLATGRGLTVLFTGPPGTGKTMAAGVMARELGLDLYQIDLSSVVSKYIGETEKQLARIFDEAERSHAVLFFDEADALFGKRSDVKDAHDRYANIETSYLLQRMESYEGVAILATNFSRNMDDAFVRRLQFVIEFVPPDEKDRRRIWERIWPPEMPRGEDLDLGLLARRFELAGGYIRNIALASAYLAAADGSALSLKHVLKATRREYQKSGRVVDESLFSPPRPTEPR